MGPMKFKVSCTLCRFTETCKRFLLEKNTEQRKSRNAIKEVATAAGRQDNYKVIMDYEMLQTYHNEF